MARATSSLPVPLSPVISTGTSVGATRAMLLKSSCMAGDVPMSVSVSRRRLVAERLGPGPVRVSRARFTTVAAWSRSNGLTR